jgi:hypothetical protein
MAESDRREKDRDRGDLKSRLVKSFLTPIAAAAASAAAGYAAKRAPDFLEQKVLPKLRSAAGDAGDVAQQLPERAKSVASGAGDVAQELGERAKSFVPGVGSSVASNRRRRTLSPQDLERRLNERAKGRAQRRKTKAR